MSATLKEALTALRLARRPEDYFGDLGDQPEQLDKGKKIYRRALQVVHPDRNPKSPLQANEALRLLNTMWKRAEASIDAGNYGSTPMAVVATIRTKHQTYAVEDVLANGDLATIYNARLASGDPVTLKVARAPADNDLIATEAKTLRYLHDLDRPEGQQFLRYLPELVETFKYQSGSKIQQANAFTAIPGLFSLENIMAAYPQGIDPRDMAWMWRRLLTILGYIHARGVVHGAVLPAHLLIQPDDHHVVLVDWCYSVNLSIDPSARIKALSTPYTAWYPKEVLSKTSPSPATDILMAARCMVQLIGGDPVSGVMPDSVPVKLQGFLLACMLPSPIQRPQDAWKLLDEFTKLIEQLWGRRTFRPFHLPT